MIPISTINPAIPIPVALALKTLARRSVDGTVQTACKHAAGNTADSSAVDDTNTEENFTTNVTIPSTFFRVGSLVKIIASGVYSTTGTPTLLFRVKFGSTNLVVFTAQTGVNNASNLAWNLEAHLVVRSLGSSGTLMAFGTLRITTASGQDRVETIVNTSATTVDMTAVQTAQVSLQWSAADTSNTSTLKNLLVFLTDYA